MSKQGTSETASNFTPEEAIVSKKGRWRRKRGFLGYACNQYGTRTAVFRCRSCHSEYSLCPAPDHPGPQHEVCLGTECESYDPERDPLFTQVTDGTQIVLDTNGKDDK